MNVVGIAGDVPMVIKFPGAATNVRIGGSHGCVEKRSMVRRRERIVDRTIFRDMILTEMIW